jgi:hypothetical protein
VLGWPRPSGQSKSTSRGAGNFQPGTAVVTQLGVSLPSGWATTTLLEPVDFSGR